jgi:hypothetical protein
MAKVYAVKPCLYMLIDAQQNRAVLRLVAPLREVSLHARLVKASSPDSCLICPPMEARGLSKLSPPQLASLIASLGGEPAETYADQIKQALKLIKATQPDLTPTDKLEKECSRLGLPEPSALSPMREPSAAKPTVVIDHAPKPIERPHKAISSTGTVWAMADELLASLGRMPTSKEIRIACEPHGIHPGTVGVQASKWIKFQQIHQIP